MEKDTEDYGNNKLKDHAEYSMRAAGDAYL